VAEPHSFLETLPSFHYPFIQEISEKLEALESRKKQIKQESKHLKVRIQAFTETHKRK
jgi:hypothetical protein